MKLILQKKVLKDDYGMKELSSQMGNIEGGSEWYEQIEVIEKKVVEEQGINWFKLNDDQTTDSVSGVTITVDSYYKVLNNVLNEAKK